MVKWDVLHIQNGQHIRVVFESISSEWRQGVWLKCDKGIIINSIHHDSLDLWFDTSPKEIECECITEDGLLHIYNIWDSGRGYRRESQALSSGMLVEEVQNGWRYCCNDLGFQTNFDKLVFRIEKYLGSQ